MSKFFAVMLSALVLVAFAVPALATEARLEALGVGNFVEDDFNMFKWYATLPSYSNNFWIGLEYFEGYEMAVAAPAAGGPGEFQSWLGASYGLGSEGKYGTLAMFFFPSTPGLNTFSGPWTGSGVFSSSLDNKWSIMYGYPMEKFSLGLYFDRADQSHKFETETPPTEETHQAYTTIGAGVRFDIGEKAYTDLAFDYDFATFKDVDNIYFGFGEVTADAKSQFGVRGRMFYELNETVTMVPFVSYRNFNFSLKGTAGDFKGTYFGNKGFEVDAALGFNFKVNEDNLLVFAVTPYSEIKVEPSDPPVGETLEDKVTLLPIFNLALESDVKDWLTFRIGAEKGFFKDKTTDETATTKDNDTDTGSYFDYHMGLGFHIGDFDIDLLVNNQLPFRVGYWLTGYNPWFDFDGPVYDISAVYHF